MTRRLVVGRLLNGDFSARLSADGVDVLNAKWKDLVYDGNGRRLTTWLSGQVSGTVTVGGAKKIAEIGFARTFLLPPPVLFYANRADFPTTYEFGRAAWSEDTYQRSLFLRVGKAGFDVYGGGGNISPNPYSHTLFYEVYDMET